MARDSSVSDGTSPGPSIRLLRGTPPTNDHRCSTRLDPAACRASVALRVVDRRLDLGAVPDDARVGEEALDVLVAEGRHGGGLEAGEGGTVAVALAQDRVPRQAGLGTLEDEQLEHVALVADGDAPLRVVVGAEELVRAVAPGTARAIGGLVHASIVPLPAYAALNARLPVALCAPRTAPRAAPRAVPRAPHRPPRAPRAVSATVSL